MAAGERFPALRQPPPPRRRPPPLSGPQYFSLTALATVRPGGPGGVRSVERRDRETGSSPWRGQPGQQGSCSPLPPSSGRATRSPLPPPRGMRFAGPMCRRSADEAGVSTSPQPRGAPPRMPPRPPPAPVEVCAAKGRPAPLRAEALSPVRSETRRRLTREPLQAPVPARRPPPVSGDATPECTDGDASLLPSTSQWVEGSCGEFQLPQSPPDTSRERTSTAEAPAVHAKQGSRRRSLSEPPQEDTAHATEGLAYRLPAEVWYGQPPVSVLWGARREPMSLSPCGMTKSSERAGPPLRRTPPLSPCRAPKGPERLSPSPCRSPMQCARPLPQFQGRKYCYIPTGASAHASLIYRKPRFVSGVPPGVAGCEVRRPTPVTASPRTYTPLRPMPC